MTDYGQHRFLSRPLCTVAEVASVLRVSTATIVRMIDRGDLEAVQVGVQWRIPSRVIIAMLGEGNMEAHDETLTLSERRR
jgi:excisionase family DNA binding protein